MWSIVALVVVTLSAVFADDRHCSLRLINVDGLKSYRHGVVYLREGESFHIICQMTGLKGESPRWAKNGQLKCDAAGADCTETSTSQTGQKKLVIRAANANTEANYTCEVGKAGSASFCGTESVTIYVASSIIHPSADFINTNETETSINCENSREKDMKAQWFRDNQPIEKSNENFLLSDHSNNNSLTIKRPRLNAGVFMCVFNTSGKTSTPLRGFVHVEGLPNVDCGKASKNLMQGDTANISCSVTGHPLPHTVIWTKAGQPFSGNMTNGGRLTLAPYGGVSNATLILRDLAFEDMGDFHIEAINSHGNDTKVVKLRVKDKLAALWPFLGIVVEVIVLVTIIFLYERRRMKKEAEEEQAEDNNELKKPLTPTGGNADGADVRQRKV